jgi:hypothetical protein
MEETSDPTGCRSPGDGAAPSRYRARDSFGTSDVLRRSVIEQSASQLAARGVGMSSDVPDWVRKSNSLWGRQKRRIWTGADWHGNVDGYAQSLLGRIRDEREGAGQGQHSQKWPEVFWGDGLDVQRSLLGLPEMPYSVLHLHYVWDPEWNITVGRKARCIGIDRETYYDHLDRAEFWIWSRLEVRACDHTQIVEAVQKIVENTLREGANAAINSQTGETPPAKQRREINYDALNRKTLSIR